MKISHLDKRCALVIYLMGQSMHNTAVFTIIWCIVYWGLNGAFYDILIFKMFFKNCYTTVIFEKAVGISITCISLCRTLKGIIQSNLIFCL